MAKEQKEVELRNYFCGYCRHKFKAYAKRTGSYVKGTCRNTCSNQIKCPECGNFLKTWGEDD